LDERGKELPQLGLMMHNLDFLKIAMWPFIDEIKILKPPKAMQIGVGYKWPKPIQVSRYMICVVMSGDNIKAKKMVSKAPTYFVFLANITIIINLFIFILPTPSAK
jgi:hypothetical protein